MSERTGWSRFFMTLLLAAGFPALASAQAIVGTAGGSTNAVVFPSPNAGLPTPVQTNVSGLPTPHQPHGVSYYGSDNALVSDNGNSRVFVIQISTSSLVDTISTAGTYNGSGTIAVAPGLTFALASGLDPVDLTPPTVSVIAAPFNASSAINTVPLPGRVLSFQTQAIVFNAAGRAFVYHTTGISVLDPPYTTIAFTIPVSNPSCGAIAISPDGNTLLATDFSGNVRVFTAPFSATSLPTTLTISGAQLDGIMVTPDGNKALAVNVFGGANLYFISAPFSASSTVETINLDTRASLPPGSFGRFEDVGISADGQLAILTGNATTNPLIPFVQAPFTAAGATVFAVNIPGGRGAGAVRFLPPGLAPGLTISKTAPASVQTGSTITYTITYGNTGTSNATNVFIRDPVPAGTSFLSATGGGVFNESDVVVWDIGTLDAGVTGQTVSFTVQVNATSGTIDNVNYTIEDDTETTIPGPPVSTTVAQGCPAITLSPSALPDGAVGSSYAQTITASGGTAPRTFSVSSGSLPPGLSLSSGGVLSGTPTSGGSYSFTVTATDANQCMGSRAYTVTITSGCPVITVSPTSLANATAGGTVRRTFSASGGTAPYTFRRTAGSFPPGLSLSTAGILSGSPTTPGTYSFTVTATDANDCSGSRAYTLRIVCATVTVSPAALVGAAQGTAYSQTLTASGGREPHTFAVTGGALPAGLVLSSGGVLSGTPTASGTFTFTVTATDASGCSGAATYTVSVCVAGLTLSPGALPGGTVGSGYGQTLVASGGAPPYAFAVTSGALPAGLTLSPAGALSGVPTAAGLFSFAVTATDVNGCPGVQSYTLRVCPVVAVSPASLPGGSVGTAYSQTLSASGGTGPYTFAASGSLPPGLALSSTGVLLGTPTQSGSFAFTATATDVNGCPGLQGYTVVVTDVPPVIEELNLAPADGGNFGLSVTGSGFVSGAVVLVNGVSYPTSFVSPTLLTVTLPASAVPATGSITVLVTNPGATGGTSNPATLTFCSAPGVPLNPTIEPAGNPTGPITATDFLRVRWDPPATGPSPAFYEFRINGDRWSAPVFSTSALALPRGINDPITLFVRAHCNADVSSPAAASPTYSLAPPVANFTFSSARVGSPVVFTDTSSPQATSWLWIFDDGAISTEQSPTHTFTTAGTHRVALIASNGSGSDQEIKDVAVSASTSSGGAVTSSVRSFERSEAGRWRLPQVAISGAGSVWLELTSEATEEAIVYLRFIDSEGWVVLERRLSVAPGQTAVNDVGSYGLEGTYTLEIVADRKVIPILAEPTEQPERERRKPDENL